MHDEINITLPKDATPYELSDALDRAGTKEIIGIELDYTILLKADHDGEAVEVKLPGSIAELCGREFTCVDCCVPMLKDLITASNNAELINTTAEVFGTFGYGELVKYKAILEAIGCFADLDSALRVIDSMDSYIVDRNVRDAESIVKEELKIILCDDDAERIMPFIDVEGYSKSLMRKYNSVITGYGLVERKDGTRLR